jgi:hypothetical protein
MVFILSDVMRNFKNSLPIIQTIVEEPESQRVAFLAYFEQACSHLKRGL